MGLLLREDLHGTVATGDHSYMETTKQCYAARRY